MQPNWFIFLKPALILTGICPAIGSVVRSSSYVCGVGRSDVSFCHIDVWLVGRGWLRHGPASWSEWEAGLKRGVGPRRRGRSPDPGVGPDPRIPTHTGPFCRRRCQNQTAGRWKLLCVSSEEQTAGTGQGGGNDWELRCGCGFHNVPM